MTTSRARTRAAAVSLVAGTSIFAAKLAAFGFTGSTAILSDAMESVVNVVAAGFALWAIRFGAKPADADHPYGHGKAEYLAAAFEGGLVAFAGVATVLVAVRSLVIGAHVRELDLGLGIALAAAAGNLALGLWLTKQGKATRSPSLVADGHHVLSDVWTTVGAMVGLALVRLTGLAVFDPLAALVVALLLARVGYRLLRNATGGLLDEEDPELVEKLSRAFDSAHVEGVRGAHHIRAIRAGDVVHVDAHVYVPAGWSVARAHEAVRQIEEAVRNTSGIPCDVALHLDPRDED